MRLRSDIGRTHIAVEREHMEWRDHRTNLMWHSRASLTYMYHRFRTGALRTHTWHGRSGLTGPPTWVGIDDLSTLHAIITAGMGVVTGVERHANRERAKNSNTHWDCRARATGILETRYWSAGRLSVLDSFAYLRTCWLLRGLILSAILMCSSRDLLFQIK
jgi:hypothetical protein